jgi:glycosyltransferase involved in cell wall biosynthesis
VIVHRGDAEEKLTLAAGDVAVCVLEIRGDPEASAGGVDAIAASLPEKVPVLPLAESDCGEVLGSATCPADVVLMTASCRPSEGWLARLRAAAVSDEMIGTVSPLGVELVGETAELRPGAVGDAAERTWPRVRTCDPHCVYLRREALALIEVPSANGDVIAGLGDEVMAAGMLNVLADDLLVPLEPRAGRGSAPADATFDEGSPAQQAVRLARIAQRTLSVTIDGRALNRIGGGTQRYVLELVLALERVGAGAASLRVVLPPDPPAAVLAELALRPRIETIRYQQALDGVARTDVVHRPQQVFSVDDLNLVRLLGDRLVITHQDLIGYHNAAYHSRPEYWERYRHATRLALAAADRTIFFSEAARHDAFAEGLGDLERTDVIGIALDEPFPEPARAPAGMSSDDEFIVCLGADYRHKNRPFALRVFAALREHHGFRGRLLLAGAHAEHGSSADLERAFLREQPNLAASVTDLGGVGEPERAWLLQNARAVMVPSVVEGFGLMPLESAAAAVPCLFAARSSLREVVSEELATLVCWDPAASAGAAAELLSDGPARDAHVRRLRDDAARWSWDALAPQLLEAYERTVRTPMAPATGLVWRTIDEELAMAGERAVHQELVDHLRGRAALARDDGFFTEEELRGLYRAGSRPALKRALLAPVRLLGRPEGSSGR